MEVMNFNPIQGKADIFELDDTAKREYITVLRFEAGLL